MLQHVKRRWEDRGNLNEGQEECEVQCLDSKLKWQRTVKSGGSHSKHEELLSKAGYTVPKTQWKEKQRESANLQVHIIVSKMCCTYVE